MPDELEELKEKANHLSKNKNWDELIPVCTRILELEPKNAQTFNNRGLAYDHKGDYDRAIEDYNRAIELDPQYANAIFNRGLAYYNKGEYDRAIEDYNQAIKLDPQHKGAIHNKAAAMAFRQAATEQEEIRKKYEAQLQQQQKEFKEQLKKYESNVLKIEKYEEREKNYDGKMEKIEKKRWKFLYVLFSLGVVLYGSLIGFYVYESFNNQANLWTLFRVFPLAILITLILSTLVWAIRWMGDDRNRLWALREDAYTCGILTILINAPQFDEPKQALTRKLFEHHDQLGTAQLIANWNKPQQATANLGDIIKKAKQEKPE